MGVEIECKQTCSSISPAILSGNVVFVLVRKENVLSPSNLLMNIIVLIIINQNYNTSLDH